MKTCATEGCERPHYAKGLCSRCYGRERSRLGAVAKMDEERFDDLATIERLRERNQQLHDQRDRLRALLLAWVDEALPPQKQTG